MFETFCLIAIRQASAWDCHSKRNMDHSSCLLPPSSDLCKTLPVYEMAKDIHILTYVDWPYLSFTLLAVLNVPLQLQVTEITFPSRDAPSGVWPPEPWDLHAALLLSEATCAAFSAWKAVLQAANISSYIRSTCDMALVSVLSGGGGHGQWLRRWARDENCFERVGKATQYTQSRVPAIPSWPSRAVRV